MSFWIKNNDEKTHHLLFIIEINKNTKGYTFVATEIVVSIYRSIFLISELGIWKPSVLFVI